MTQPSTKDTKTSAKDANPSTLGKNGKPKARAKARAKQSDDGCCKTMANYVMFIVIVFGLTFFHLKRFQYNDHFITADGKGELSTRHFVSDLNTILCGNYKVSGWHPLDVYLTSGEARVDKVNRERVKRDAYQLYPNSMGVDNSFYLLEGSLIKVNACITHPRSSPHVDMVPVDMLVFKGDDSWKKYKNGDCEDCAVGNVSLPVDTDCKDKREAVMTYTVSDRDTYRVVIANKGQGFNTYFVDYLRGDLNINRTIFDTTDAKKICTQNSECLVPLQYDQDVDVVVKFGGDAFLTTECQFRLMFCIGIFVILPSCLLILGFTCCAVLTIAEKNEKKKKQKNSPNLQQTNVNTDSVDVRDKSSLMKNELPPSYDSLNSV